MTLLFVLGLSAVLRTNLVHVPMNRDEGSFAYVAEMLRQGGALYRDALDHKPPGVWLVYWLWSHAIAFDALQLHLLLLVYNLVTLVVLVAFVEAIASMGAALWAGLVYAVMSSAWQVEGYSASAEMFMVLPTLASLFLCVSGAAKRSSPRLALAGLLGAACFWIKQPYALVGLFQAVYVFVASGETGCSSAQRVRAGTKALVALGLGFAVPSAALCGYFALTGRWSDFVYWAFTHSLDYATSTAGPSFAEAAGRQIKSILACNPVAWLAAVAGCVLELRRDRRAGLLLSGFLTSTFIAAFHSVFMYRHYLVFLVAPLSVAAGIGIARIEERWLSTPRLRALVRVAVAGGIALLPVLVDWRYYVARTPAQHNHFLYHANPFAESPRIAAYLAEHTSPEDALLILGSEPQILVEAHRRSATRHLFMYQVVGPYRRASQSQREVMDDARGANAPYAVLVNVDSSWLPDPASSQRFSAELLQWLARNYVPEAVVGRVGSDPEVVPLASLPEEYRASAPNQAKVVICRRRHTDGG